MDLIDAPPRATEPRQRFEFPAARPDRNFGSGALVPMSLVGLSALSSHAATAECAGIYFMLDPDPIRMTVLWRESDPERLAGWHETNRFLWGCHVVFPDLRPETRVPSGHSGMASVAHMLQEIATAFSLSTSRLANILQTSRQTVYEWRAGQAPHPKSRQRIRDVYALAHEWLRQSRWPVGDAFDWTDLATGRSLADLLSRDAVDTSEVLAHFRRLAAALDDSWASADRDVAEAQGRPGAVPPAKWQRAMQQHLKRRG